MTFTYSIHSHILSAINFPDHDFVYDGTSANTKTEDCDLYFFLYFQLEPYFQSDVASAEKTTTKQSKHTYIFENKRMKN